MTLTEDDRIPRVVSPPPLTANDGHEITSTVFTHARPEAADILFIFGTSQADWDLLAAYGRSGTYGHIVVNGRTGQRQRQTGRSLASLMCDELVARGVADHQILVQDQSTNTREDAHLGLALLTKRSLVWRTLCFASKEHHSGRCARVLAALLPGQAFGAITHPAVYERTPITRSTWYDTSVGRGRVYGEYLRIMRYARVGHIAREEPGPGHFDAKPSDNGRVISVERQT